MSQESLANQWKGRGAKIGTAPRRMKLDDYDMFTEKE